MYCGNEFNFNEKLDILDFNKARQPPRLDKPIQTMSYINGFPAIAAADARILILGSIPGKASLHAEQYYAHPRNQFWPIICQVLMVDSNCPYPSRIQALTEAGIALWDVVKYCYRPSSLDTDIDKQSIITNDFVNFFLEQPLITHVFFNGSTAEQTFRKHVQPSIPPGKLTYRRLPSTSPAHAAMSFQDKFSEWQILTSLISR